jgi:hypothetical protein
MAVILSEAKDLLWVSRSASCGKGNGVHRSRSLIASLFGMTTKSRSLVASLLGMTTVDSLGMTA